MTTKENSPVEAIREVSPRGSLSFSATELRRLAIDAGADDAGVVAIDRAELDIDRADLAAAVPWAKSVVAIVVRMNREPIRSPARSVANLEFHEAGDQVDEVARRIVARLEAAGVRAVNPAMGFPMEMNRFPGKLWTVSHKMVAVAAGLGRMGIHRNVIHPKFGNFILLGTVLTAVEIETEEQDRPVDYNPCLECKLCVAACPVGAISPQGDFNFLSCYTHNYREFMGGFTDWVEQLADSRNAKDYRGRVKDHESASWWQSLSYGANYKAAYCLAVCPAGEDVISPFREDRKQFLDDVVRPLQKQEEDVYVVVESDAEEYVRKRFPHKRVRHVGNSLRPGSIDGFLDGMRFTFQPGHAGDLSAAYHFTFTGETHQTATVVIDAGKLDVHRGHVSEADLHVQADSKTWLGFLRKDHGLVWALIRRKIKIAGDPRMLIRFGKCFPAG